MKDFLGQELNIGDNVVNIATPYGASKQLRQSKVVKLGKSMVTLDSGTKDPSKIIKIDTILNNLNNEYKRGKDN